jgi:chromosomal replication initiation ATPase DnaA
MAALNKIAATSSSRSSPSELETSIANALYELETNIPDLKSALRPLQFVSAREVSFPFSRSLATISFPTINLTFRLHFPDRSRPRQKGHHHLRTRSSTPRLP